MPRRRVSPTLARVALERQYRALGRLTRKQVGVALSWALPFRVWLLYEGGRYILRRF